MKRSEQTKDKILKTGLKMWLNKPSSVTANAIAKKIGMSHGTVLYHFPYGVRDAVAEYAVSVKNERVICQLIAENHNAVKDLSTTERLEFLNSCAHKTR